jgi:hypothetical protein
MDKTDKNLKDGKERAWFVVAYVLFLLSFFEVVYAFMLDVSLLSSIIHCQRMALPLQLPFFVFLAYKLKTVGWFQKLFSWKLYIVPLLCLFAFSMVFWHLDMASSYQTMFLGCKWSFHAIATHSLFFGLLLFLFQRKVSNFEGFLLSYLTVYLNGIVYEMPILFESGLLGGIFFMQMLPLTLCIYVFMLIRNGFRFSKKLVLGMLLLFVGYLTYSFIPSWGLRLISIPLMASLPFSIASASKQSTINFNRSTKDVKGPLSKSKVDVVCVCRKLPNVEWFKNLNKIPVDKLIIETSKPLGVARMRAIQKVSTEYFVFLDDDAILCDNWYKEIVCHLEPNVAAISGMSLLKGFGDMWDLSINAYRFQNGNKTLKTGERMSTVNALLKTDVVRDWKPSRLDVEAWEDYEIGQHIIKKGFVVLGVPSCCYHFLGWKRFIKNGLWSSKSMKKVLSSKQLVRIVFKSLGGVSYYFLLAILRWNRAYLFVSIENAVMLLGLFH